ncbi:MAG: DEAD/DEAH box helicase [Prevotella sp.]|nr:DEAD/DEAH box helicase [Prevotella sp.]
MGDMLRDYQQEMLERLHDAWEEQQSVMVQMPAGTGKTHLMAAVIRENMAHGVLIVAHRVELIGQISQTLESFGIEHGIVDRTTLDLDRKTKEHKVVVASIQTLARRMATANYANDKNFRPQLVIIDEAHHAVAKTYRLLWEMWPEAKFLGLTATPCRLNGTGFTDLFDTLLESYSIQEFIDREWLSDFEYVSVTPENWMVERIAGLKKRGADGDYQMKEMATVMDSQESIAHLYQSYLKFTRGKKGIVYAISREHAQHISDYYVNHGVKCCWIEAMTPAEERQRLVDAYRQGEIDVIVNVDIFSEGFDCPEVEFIQLARPTLSLTKYLQQVGRGMRPVPFKDYVTILDQVGLYQTFGLPTEERDWNGMFRGITDLRNHGKGGRHRLVLRDDLKELTLVNLQMVRIRRSGEPHQHVEVFLENGRYGILKDGEVSCPAVFVKMRRAESPYFAVATYPFEVYKNRKTVIGEDGKDMDLRIYGKVEQREEYMVYDDEKGRQMWWDGKGGRNYSHRPGFEQIGNFDVVKEGSQYMLRKSNPLTDFKFNKEDVLVGPVFSIFKNVLVFNDYKRMFRISGYQENGVIVDTGRRPHGEMQVMADGTIRKVTYIPMWERWERPQSMKRLGLRRVKTE